MNSRDQIRLEGLRDAYNLLCQACAQHPLGSLTCTFLASAANRVAAEIVKLERPMFEDSRYECGECGETVENGEAHDCPAYQHDDTYGPNSGVSIQ